MLISFPKTSNHALAEIQIIPGQTIVVRPEAVLATTHLLKRSDQGTNLDFVRHQVGEHPTTVWLIPSFAGFLQDIRVDTDGLQVRRANLMAYSEELSSHSDWTGLETPPEKPQDWLRLTGFGTALVSGFGSLYPIQIDGKYLINPTKIIAMQGRISFTENSAHPTHWQRLTGMSTLSCCFYGAGTLWCQSHHPSPLAKQLAPRLHRHRGRAWRAS